MKRILILLCGLLLLHNVHADDGLHISGFSTIGGVYANTSHATYIPEFYSQSAKVASGNNGKVSFLSESKFGLQADYKVNDGLTFTTQLLAEHNHGDKFNIEAELAFARIRLNESVDFRIGRIRPVVYMLSDYYNVNYTNLWTRPPREMYTLVPITRMEGFDFIYKKTIDDVTFIVQPFFGISKINMSDPGYSLDTTNIRGLNVMADLGNLTLRAGYSQANIRIVRPSVLSPIKNIFNNPALLPIGHTTLGSILNIPILPKSQTIINDLIPSDNISRFTSFGFMYERSGWVFNGEYGVRTTDFFDPDTRSWYLILGKKINNWTPFISYSAVKVTSKGYYKLTDYNSGYGPMVDAVVNDGLTKYGTALISSLFTGEETRTLGLRYELTDKSALKIQLDNIKTRTAKDSSLYKGLFEKPDSYFMSRSRSVNVLSLTLDFIF